MYKQYNYSCTSTLTHSKINLQTSYMHAQTPSVARISCTGSIGL